MVGLSASGPVSEHMSSLGATFRKEREARNISLEEIAAKTKIGIRLLRAIENERFELLPGGIFSISFVRQYARCLGLNEEAAVREYLEVVGAEREAVPAERTRPLEPPVSGEGADYPRILLAAVLLGVLAVGIAYGVYRLHAYLTAAPAPEEGRTDHSLAVVTAPAPSPAPEEGFPEIAGEEGALPAVESPPKALATPSSSLSAPALPSVSSVASIPTPAGASATTRDAPVLPEELELRIDAHGPVWISITADGVKQWQGTMRANQSREVKATESVRLTVGDAAMVLLTLNGKSLPALGRPGEVRNLTITAKSIPESTP